MAPLKYSDWRRECNVTADLNPDGNRLTLEKPKGTRNITLLVRPPPCNSDHQDYYTFSRGSQKNRSLSTVTGRGLYPNYIHHPPKINNNTYGHHHLVWSQFDCWNAALEPLAVNTAMLHESSKIVNWKVQSLMIQVCGFASNIPLVQIRSPSMFIWDLQVLAYHTSLPNLPI